jgi:hypothetical protein
MALLGLTVAKRDTFITQEAADKVMSIYLSGNPFNICPHYIRPCYFVRYLRTFSWFQTSTAKSHPQRKYNEFNFREYVESLPDPNIQDLSIETEKSPYLVKTKTGMFFFNDFDYQKLNHLTSTYSELLGLNFFMKNQLAVSK